MVYGFFSAAIPYTRTLGAITSVSLVAPNGLPVPILNPVTGTYGESLPNLFVGRPFTIEITSPIQPAGSESRSDIITLTEQNFAITWRVIDPAQRNQNLFEYQVLYSHDGGRIWTPLAVNLPGTVQTITVNRTALCSTLDILTEENPRRGPVGIIRVLGSDGLNTAVDDVYVSFTGNPVDPLYCRQGTNRELPDRETLQ